MFTLLEDTWDYSVCHWILLRSPKRKIIAKSSKHGQLPITAKQQLAIATPFKLKITKKKNNNQT